MHCVLCTVAVWPRSVNGLHQAHQPIAGFGQRPKRPPTDGHLIVLGGSESGLGTGTGSGLG